MSEKRESKKNSSTLTKAASAYAIFASLTSGLGGTLGMAEPVLHDDSRYKSLSNNVVREDVYAKLEGVPFIASLESLSRDWDFSANQVCTDKNKSELVVIVPLTASSGSCQPMTDFPEEKIAEAKAALEM